MKVVILQAHSDLYARDKEYCNHRPCRPRENHIGGQNVDSRFAFQG